MSDLAQPPWSDPIAELTNFRDLATRMEAPFNDLPRPEGRLHAVLGGARMGKTSLLNVLPDWLLQEPTRRGQQLVPTHIHYSQDAGDLASPRTFLLRLIKELREGVRERGLCTISGKDFEPFFGDVSYLEGFRTALRFLLDQVDKVSLEKSGQLGQVRLIGLVDDAEEIAHLAWADDLFYQLRELYAREESVRRSLDLVLSGGDRLDRHFGSEAPWSDGHRLCLCPMAPEVISDWLQDVCAGQLSPGLAQGIIAESGGQPFLIRYFVDQVRRQAERRGWDGLPPDLMERLSEYFVRQHRDVLNGWVHSIQWADAHYVTWATYDLLSSAGNDGMDIITIEDELWAQGHQIDVEQTLERLVWLGVIRRAADDARRFVASGVFRRYFREHKDEVELEPPGERRTQPWVAPGIGPTVRPRLDLEYHDFTLRLSGEGEFYRVHVTSPQGEATGEFRNPLSLTEQAATWPDATERAGASGELEGKGGRLFRAIFNDEVLARFRSTCESALGEVFGLRVKLILEPAELHAVPWEFLYDAEMKDFLALSRKISLVRYVEQPRQIPQLRSIQQLRLLVVVAGLADRPGLDVTREIRNIQTALEPWRKEGWLEYDILQGPEATALNLQETLIQQNYHVFHFSGHGAFQTASGEGLILLAGEGGQSDPLMARQLARLLRDEAGIRLVFLNACETALGSETAPFASVAGTLVQAGVPAVVATQYAISDGAANSFARGFYQALAAFHPVEAAVAEGRKAIDLSERNYEWGVPVLYLRAQNGRVFG